MVAENDLIATNSSYLDSLWDYQVVLIGVEAAIGKGLKTFTSP